MFIDTTKPVSKVLFNGEDIPLEKELAESDLIDTTKLPLDNINDNKIYRVFGEDKGEYYVKPALPSGFVISYKELLLSYDWAFTNVEVIPVNSINEVTEPNISVEPNLYIYAIKDTYNGYIFVDETTKFDLSEFLYEYTSLNMNYVGLVNSQSDMGEPGIYYIRDVDVTIGVPNANGNKYVYGYNGEEWIKLEEPVEPPAPVDVLNYDTIAGIWYSVEYNGENVESLMYYILPLLQDNDGKRNIKVYSINTNGFYDSTTQGMHYIINNNQVNILIDGNIVGTYNYEFVNNEIHLTTNGEIVFKKLITGLGKNDTGAFVSNNISKNGTYNALSFNDPEVLFFNAIINIENESTGLYSVESILKDDGTQKLKITTNGESEEPETPEEPEVIEPTWYTVFSGEQSFNNGTTINKTHEFNTDNIIVEHPSGSGTAVLNPSMPQCTKIRFTGKTYNTGTAFEKEMLKLGSIEIDDNNKTQTIEHIGGNEFDITTKGTITKKEGLIINKVELLIDWSL